MQQNIYTQSLLSIEVVQPGPLRVMEKTLQQ
jgi:hypothetical protein